MRPDTNRPIDRLLLFLDNKGIKPGTYEKNAPLSQAYFANTKKGKGYISQEVLEKLRVDFPELNFYWLLFEQGEMIVPVTQEVEKIAIESIKVNAPYTQSGKNAQVNAQKGAQETTVSEENCRVCAEKEKRVETLERLVVSKEKTIADKVQIIEEKEKNIQLLEHIINPDKTTVDKDSTSKERKKVG